MAIVEARESSLSRHGNPDQYRWRWLTGVFVRGRFRRFGDRTVPGRVIWRRDPYIRGGERFDDERDVPRSILAARFPGRYNLQVDIIEPDSVQPEAGFNGDGEQLGNGTYLLVAVNVSAEWKEPTVELLTSPRIPFPLS